MMTFPAAPAAAADDFVKWLGGYLDGLRACADLGARPPAHLDQIYAKLAELREKPKTASISIHRNEHLAPGAMVIGGAVARTLELKPAEFHLHGFARGGIANAVACAAYERQTHAPAGGFATGGEIGPQTRRAISSLEARR